MPGLKKLVEKGGFKLYYEANSSFPRQPIMNVDLNKKEAVIYFIENQGLKEIGTSAKASSYAENVYLL